METENFIREQVRKILTEAPRSYVVISDNYSSYAKRNSSKILSTLGITSVSRGSGSSLDAVRSAINDALQNKYFNEVFDGPYVSGPFLYVSVNRSYTKSRYRMKQAARYIGSIVAACVQERLISAPSGFEISYDEPSRKIRLKFN